VRSNVFIIISQILTYLQIKIEIKPKANRKSKPNKMKLFFTFKSSSLDSINEKTNKLMVEEIKKKFHSLSEKGISKKQFEFFSAT
jgi:hypothetical protein